MELFRSQASFQASVMLLATVEAQLWQAQLAAKDKPAPHHPIRVIIQRVQTLTAQNCFQAASKTAVET
jgi:hypothetical protein